MTGIGLSSGVEVCQKFPNRNWSLSFLNKLLKKIDHAVNEAAVFVLSVV